MTLSESIGMMITEIASVLVENKPTIYLYGSVSLNDFRYGWSDIDILVLTETEISEKQANALVLLRQDMLKKYPDNLHFRLFEGGMLSAHAFMNNTAERTVYWGTSGERITDRYELNSLSMTELLDSGALLYGDDIRGNIARPTYAQMRDDIRQHVQSARKYGRSVGWLLDIARGSYTLKTGKIISKAAAGEWVLSNGIYPEADFIEKAMAIRKEPTKYTREHRTIDNAVIQRFADLIDAEFANTIELFAMCELERMKITYTTLSLIRDKDGVSVWRVTTDTDNFVMKCFDKTEYRREITNYQLLNELGIPTLKMIAHTDVSLLIEDIGHSVYRLATPDDIKNPMIAEKISLWYKMLHQKGREYAKLHTLYDECDCLTLENLENIKQKTGMQDFPLWDTIEVHFKKIQSTVTELPRTITYNDFHYTNLVVAKDGSSALLFDYNMLGKGYAYSDIRNVCGQFGSQEAQNTFLAVYGSYDEKEKIIDDVINVLNGLHIACGRGSFPAWGNELIEMVKDGRLLAAVEKLAETLLHVKKGEPMPEQTS